MLKKIGVLQLLISSSDLLSIGLADKITHTRSNKILSLGTMWLVMLLIDLWLYYAHATQCCGELCAEFGCAKENGAECMGLYYCHETMETTIQAIPI